MLQIKRDYLPPGHRNRPGYKMVPKGIMVHATANWSDGAGDEMHGEYMRNTTRTVSWHITVDKDSATQHIPDYENAWHAGDGANGEYNRNWLSIEIACEAVEYGEPLDDATYRNAVDVTAQKMLEYDFNETQLQPHRIVYGKNCPHDTLFSWEQFKRDVMQLVNQRKNNILFSKEDAQLVINLLSDLWFASGKKGVQEAAHYAANALRKATGIEGDGRG